MSKTPATAQWMEPEGAGVEVTIGVGQWIADPDGDPGDALLSSTGVAAFVWAADPLGDEGDLVLAGSGETPAAYWLRSGNSYLLRRI